MGFREITLTGAMRQNLIALQTTADYMGKTQERLATGKRVNSALDNPQNYFAAQSYMQRAGDFNVRKDGMSEGVQTVKAADAGIKAITTLIDSMKGLLTSARSSDDEGRADLITQYQEMRNQIDDMAEDSGYKGKNLLLGDDLVVEFNEEGDNTIKVEGFEATTYDAATEGDLSITSVATTTAWNNYDAGGTALTTVDSGSTLFVGDYEIDQALGELNDAIDVLRAKSSALSSNLSVITAREEFTDDMINVLTIGADNLTLADTDEEGANMLMLQTRQALGTTSLSLSSQAAQSILRLF